MKKNIKKAWNLARDIGQYFHRGWKLNLLVDYTRTFFLLSLAHINNLRGKLVEIQKDKNEQLHKLYNVTKGLHSLLPAEPAFSYSILIPVDASLNTFLEESSADLLRSCLLSACRQTAPAFEILLGFESPPAEAVKTVVSELKKAYPMLIREFYALPASPTEGMLLNRLAKEAKGNFLLVMDPVDWLRPDLLYRYELTLRALPQPAQTVIACFLNEINERDVFLPNSLVKRTMTAFPYFFAGTFDMRGCLFPKDLWEKVGGLSSTYKGAEAEDFVLRLNAAGSACSCIPLALYSSRRLKGRQMKKTTRQSLLQALDAYTNAQHLDWQWQAGYRDGDVRAIPMLKQEHQVQVVIPFKDQKALTMSCIQSLLKQKGVTFKITAVDNASQDASIAADIKALGGEVLTIHEPFNYSRLNNLAVKQTKIAKDCDLLLFLNNDVDLHADALLEMVRWIDQPQIGMVGCRLHFPDGRLQHGGVKVDYDRQPGMMCWEHVEKYATFDEMQQTKSLGVVDAVTAACALMKRQVFLDVGGFDEIWYPIAYSDTNLAIKLHLKGLKCFYTPYAYGVHHESVSRKEGIEDFENSSWLHRHLLSHQHHIPLPYFH